MSAAGQCELSHTDHNYSVLSASISPNEKDQQTCGTERLDAIICQFLREQNVPGATLAVAKHGRLVYQQGYGVAGAGRRMTANMALRVASISKPVTAIAVMRLCQEGRLSLDARVFGRAGILRRLKARGDKRLKEVRVRHLLQHSAGWDRDLAGDAVFTRVTPPDGMATTSDLYNAHLLQHALYRKLQFTPGTRHAYSNLGYLVLGEVIEVVTEQTYESYVTSLLTRIGITDMYVGQEERASWLSSEAEYFNIKEPTTMASVMPGQGESSVLPQYGSFLMRNTGAFGGWVATAADLVHLLGSLEQSGTPDSLLDASSFSAMLERPAYESGRDWYGFGLDVQDGGQTWGHTGAMEGTSGTCQRHHSGLTWAFLLNAWASDTDLDGVVKCALSSATPDLSPFPPHVAQVCGGEVQVTTADHRQCVMTHLSLSRLFLEVELKRGHGFTAVWVGVNTKGMDLSFNVIFSRNPSLHGQTKIVLAEKSQLSAALKAFSLGNILSGIGHDLSAQWLPSWTGSAGRETLPLCSRGGCLCSCQGIHPTADQKEEVWFPCGESECVTVHTDGSAGRNSRHGKMCRFTDSVEEQTGECWKRNSYQ
ncbi:esterase EstB-like [Babylonia areolata]|uniref:esterase EstB-like n=1 Tax=Babylonia areolata TaxID=304850 RepID=UPI003FD40B79